MLLNAQKINLNIKQGVMLKTFLSAFFILIAFVFTIMFFFSSASFAFASETNAQNAGNTFAAATAVDIVGADNATNVDNAIAAADNVPAAGTTSANNDNAASSESENASGNEKDNTSNDSASDKTSEDNTSSNSGDISKDNIDVKSNDAIKDNTNTDSSASNTDENQNNDASTDTSDKNNDASQNTTDKSNNTNSANSNTQNTSTDEEDDNTQKDDSEKTETVPAGGTRVLEDGHIYIFYSGVSNKSIEVYRGNTNDGAQITQYTTNNTKAQQWRVSYDENNYVTFTNVKTGKVLQVVSGNAYSRAGVEQYTSNGSLAQKWIVTKLSGKYYRIASALDSRFVLDVYNGSKKNDTKIWLFKNNNSLAQKWMLYDLTAGREEIKTLVGKTKSALPAGMYTIVSSLSNKALDVTGGSTSAGANVQLWTQNNTFAQKWRLSYDENGYATFNCVISGYNLDDVDGKTANGTNIRQWYRNTSNAQKWVIVANENGTYTIVSALFPNMVLDVYNGNKNDGANVNLWRSNSSAAQQWKFSKTQVYIYSGIYALKSKVNTSRAIDLDSASHDNSAKIQLWDYNKTNAQKWYIKKNSDNTYTIQSTESAKYLTSKDDGSLYQRTKVSGNSQLWTINYYTGYYVFKNKLTGKFLDLSGALDENGATILTWEGNGTKAQRWKVVAVAPIEAGTYFLATKLDTSKVLGAAAGNWASGTNADIGANVDSGTQKWKLIRNTDYRTYTLINAASKNALDVDSGNGTKGANVQVWTENGSDAQKWHICWNPDQGYFYLKSHLNTSLCLDVVGANTSEGTNVQIYTKNNTKAQGWYFTATTYVEPVNTNSFLRGIDIASWEAGIDIYAVDADFIIVKVSQGTSYINPYWYDWAWAVLQSGKKLGLYHYAGGNDAVAEADFFVNQIGDFIGRAVLVIDWESEQNSAYSAQGEWWTGAWRARVKERTGISAWTYISQSISHNFAGPLWIAQYPNYDDTGYQDYPWNEGAYSCICRQYTSSGRIGGYGGHLDLNKFYGNASEWDAWASGQRS